MTYDEEALMRSKFFFAAIFLALFLVSDASFSLGFAEPTTGMSPMKASLTHVLGKVLIQPSGSASARDAKVGDVVGSGDKVETKADGLAEIMLENNNVINLKPNSVITMTELSANPTTGIYVNRLYADMGKFRIQVEKMSGASTFEVRTPTAVAAVRGTQFYVDVEQVKTLLAILEGTVAANVYYPDPVPNKLLEPVLIPEGEFVVITTVITPPAPFSDQDYNDIISGWGQQPTTNLLNQGSNQSEEFSESERPEGSRFR